MKSTEDDKLMPPMVEPRKTVRVSVRRVLKKKAYSGAGAAGGMGIVGGSQLIHDTTSTGMSEAVQDDNARTEDPMQHEMSENDIWGMAGAGGGERIASDISPLAKGFLANCKQSGMNDMEIKTAIDRMADTFDDRTISELRHGFEKVAFRGQVMNFMRGLGGKAKNLFALSRPLKSDTPLQQARRFAVSPTGEAHMQYLSTPTALGRAWQGTRGAYQGAKGMASNVAGKGGAGALTGFFNPELSQMLGMEAPSEEGSSWTRRLTGAALGGLGQRFTPQAWHQPVRGAVTGTMLGAGADQLAGLAGVDTRGWGARAGALGGGLSRMTPRSAFMKGPVPGAFGKGLPTGGPTAFGRSMPGQAAQQAQQFFTGFGSQGLGTGAKALKRGLVYGPLATIPGAAGYQAMTNQVNKHVLQSPEAQKMLTEFNNKASTGRGWSGFMDSFNGVFDPIMDGIFGEGTAADMGTWQKLAIGAGVLSMLGGGIGSMMGMKGGGALGIIGLLLTLGGGLGPSIMKSLGMGGASRQATPGEMLADSEFSQRTPEQMNQSLGDQSSWFANPFGNKTQNVETHGLQPLNVPEKYRAGAGQAYNKLMGI
jgi:hypothetical protein